jgi:hypothetical protein
MILSSPFLSLILTHKSGCWTQAREGRVSNIEAPACAQPLQQGQGKFETNSNFKS